MTDWSDFFVAEVLSVVVVFVCAGDYDAAIQLYDDILKENKANLIVMKRKVMVRYGNKECFIRSSCYDQVAALRSQGKNVLAVEALHDIVKVFQSDAPSWLELADIHLSLCDYQSAAFCYEEVVLLMPSNAPMYIRLAETLYTIGTSTCICFVCFGSASD